jgi:hypothetical protein
MYELSEYWPVVAYREGMLRSIAIDLRHQPKEHKGRIRGRAAYQTLQPQLTRPPDDPAPLLPLKPKWVRPAIFRVNDAQLTRFKPGRLPDLAQHRSMPSIASRVDVGVALVMEGAQQAALKVEERAGEPGVVRGDHEHLDGLLRAERIQVAQTLGLLFARRRCIEDRVEKHQAGEDLAALLRSEPADDAR